MNTLFTLPSFIGQIGDAIVVAHQNEAYSHFQCELRKRFPNHSVIVMNVTNGGDIGYLPPEEFYVRDSYPVWQTPFAAGALEFFTTACSVAITELISKKPIPN